MSKKYSLFPLLQCVRAKKDEDVYFTPSSTATGLTFLTPAHLEWIKLSNMENFLVTISLFVSKNAHTVAKEEEKSSKRPIFGWRQRRFSATIWSTVQCHLLGPNLQHKKSSQCDAQWQFSSLSGSLSHILSANEIQLLLTLQEGSSSFLKSETLDPFGSSYKYYRLGPSYFTNHLWKLFQGNSVSSSL